jgi:glycosyltransferase involved in cell wall biosynthesis
VTLNTSSRPGPEQPEAPRLAICVFTHDGRRDVLAQALASVFDQLDDRLAGHVEVCVTDNASNDGTERLITDLQHRHGERLRYVRHARDLGASLNLLSCVELARADYCWLLASDDVIEDGGIARVVALIADAPPGIVVGKANFDFALTGLADQGGEDFYPLEQRRTVRYGDLDRFLSECGLLASVVSTLVVRRASWRSELDGLGGRSFAATTLFPHLPIVIAMARRDPSWIWCPAKFVRVRTGNAAVACDDGWSTDQIHTRYLRDLGRIWARHLDRGSRSRTALLRRAYRSFLAPGSLLASAPQGRSTRRRLNLIKAYSVTFWRLPDFWLEAVPALLSADGSRVARSASRPTPPIALEQRVARIDARLGASVVPNSHEIAVGLQIQNATPFELGDTQSGRVVVGYRWESEAGHVSLQGPPIPLPETLAPGAWIGCEVRVLTPTAPGAYSLRVALAQEDVGWFDDRRPEFACVLEIEVACYGWTDNPVCATPRRSG